jgi:hypothetical protein
MDHYSNLSQNRGRNQTIESHIYTGDEHHDVTNIDHNQSIVTRSKYNLTGALHKRRINQAAQEEKYKIEQL